MSEIDSLLQEYRVTAYMHGHVHSLELSKYRDTMYVLSGAGSKDFQFRTKSAGGNASPLFNQLVGDVGFVRAGIDHTGFVVEYHGIDDDSLLFRSDPVGPRQSVRQ
jgi:hypothetical protein